jgi:hypothetical protein
MKEAAEIECFGSYAPQWLRRSHSEIEVSRCDTWGPEQIKARGLKLLKFLEDRQNTNFFCFLYRRDPFCKTPSGIVRSFPTVGRWAPEQAMQGLSFLDV